MNFLLDTNAISELSKSRINARFEDWYDGQDISSLYISALTLGELQRGTWALPEGGRRTTLEDWIASMVIDFHLRILPIDLSVANAWAHIALRHRAARRTVSAFDELIAATAITHGLTLVTRNVRDFDASGCRLLSPWT